MKLSNRVRAGTALVVCAAVGAAGGIAGSAAAPGSKSATSKSRTTSTTAAPARPGRPARGPGHHAVHAEAVVLNKAGTAFITVTTDSGKIKSVDGRDVTITEAIGSVTYKDVTIALPADAKIVRNGKTATVGDLKANDRIHVAQSSDGTFVNAGDASFRPGPGPGRGHGRGHRHGPPPGP